jgi:hypothetical protein
MNETVSVRFQTLLALSPSLIQVMNPTGGRPEEAE